MLAVNLGGYRFDRFAPFFSVLLWFFFCFALFLSMFCSVLLYLCSVLLCFKYDFVFTEMVFREDRGNPRKKEAQTRQIRHDSNPQLPTRHQFMSTGKLTRKILRKSRRRKHYTKEIPKFHVLRRGYHNSRTNQTNPLRFSHFSNRVPRRSKAQTNLHLCNSSESHDIPRFSKSLIQAMHSSQNPAASSNWVYREPFKHVHLGDSMPVGGGVSRRHLQAAEHQGDGEGHSQLGEDIEALLRPFLEASLFCHFAYLVQ